MESKKVTAEVSKECWKALKVLAVQKELPLHAVVAEVLEKGMKKKVKDIQQHLEVSEDS